MTKNTTQSNEKHVITLHRFGFKSCQVHYIRNNADT